jgi:hypothetical protein
MKKFKYLASVLLVTWLISACQDHEATETHASDQGCAPPTTFGSGAPPNGPISFGIMHGNKSGGTAGQVHMLLTEFNNAAQKLGDAYCAQTGCYAEMIPATDKNIKTGRSDSYIGWTELTILPTGGKPKTITQGLNVYFSYIDPPSPNCYCKHFVFEPENITIESLKKKKDSTTTTTPPVTENPPTENPPTETNCGDPSPALTIPAGTLLSIKTWRVNSYQDDIETYPGLLDYVNTTGPAAARSFLDAKLLTVHCPEGCEAYWDPEPDIKKESGYPNMPYFTYIVRYVLGNEITAKCRRKQ